MWSCWCSSRPIGTSFSDPLSSHFQESKLLTSILETLASASGHGDLLPGVASQNYLHFSRSAKKLIFDLALRLKEDILHCGAYFSDPTRRCNSVVESEPLMVPVERGPAPKDHVGVVGGVPLRRGSVGTLRGSAGVVGAPPGSSVKYGVSVGGAVGPVGSSAASRNRNDQLVNKLPLSAVGGGGPGAGAALSTPRGGLFLPPPPPPRFFPPLENKYRFSRIDRDRTALPKLRITGPGQATKQAWPGVEPAELECFLDNWGHVYMLIMVHHLIWTEETFDAIHAVTNQKHFMRPFLQRVEQMLIEDGKSYMLSLRIGGVVGRFPNVEKVVQSWYIGGSREREGGEWDRAGGRGGGGRGGAAAGRGGAGGGGRRSKRGAGGREEERGRAEYVLNLKVEEVGLGRGYLERLFSAAKQMTGGDGRGSANASSKNAPIAGGLTKELLELHETKNVGAVSVAGVLAPRKKAAAGKKRPRSDSSSSSSSHVSSIPSSDSALFAGDRKTGEKKRAGARASARGGNNKRASARKAGKIGGDKRNRASSLSELSSSSSDESTTSDSSLDDSGGSSAFPSSRTAPFSLFADKKLQYLWHQPGYRRPPFRMRKLSQLNVLYDALLKEENRIRHAKLKSDKKQEKVRAEFYERSEHDRQMRAARLTPIGEEEGSAGPIGRVVGDSSEMIIMDEEDIDLFGQAAGDGGPMGGSLDEGDALVLGGFPPDRNVSFGGAALLASGAADVDYEEEGGPPPPRRPPSPTGGGERRGEFPYRDSLPAVEEELPSPIGLPNPLGGRTAMVAVAAPAKPRRKKIDRFLDGDGVDQMLDKSSPDKARGGVLVGASTSADPGGRRGGEANDAGPSGGGPPRAGSKLVPLNLVPPDDPNVPFAGGSFDDMNSPQSSDDNAWFDPFRVVPSPALSDGMVGSPLGSEDHFVQQPYQMRGSGSPSPLSSGRVEHSPRGSDVLDLSDFDLPMPPTPLEHHDPPPRNKRINPMPLCEEALEEVSPGSSYASRGGLIMLPQDAPPPRGKDIEDLNEKELKVWSKLVRTTVPREELLPVEEPFDGPTGVPGAGAEELERSTSSKNAVVGTNINKQGSSSKVVAGAAGEHRRGPSFAMSPEVVSSSAAHERGGTPANGGTPNLSSGGGKRGIMSSSSMHEVSFGLKLSPEIDGLGSSDDQRFLDQQGPPPAQSGPGGGFGFPSRHRLSSHASTPALSPGLDGADGEFQSPSFFALNPTPRPGVVAPSGLQQQEVQHQQHRLVSSMRSFDEEDESSQRTESAYVLHAISSMASDEDVHNARYFRQQHAQQRMKPKERLLHVLAQPWIVDAIAYSFVDERFLGRRGGLELIKNVALLSWLVGDDNVNPNVATTVGLGLSRLGTAVAGTAGATSKPGSSVGLEQEGSAVGLLGPPPPTEGAAPTGVGGAEKLRSSAKLASRGTSGVGAGGEIVDQASPFQAVRRTESNDLMLDMFHEFKGAFKKLKKDSKRDSATLLHAQQDLILGLPSVLFALPSSSPAPGAESDAAFVGGINPYPLCIRECLHIINLVQNVLLEDGNTGTHVERREGAVLSGRAEDPRRASTAESAPSHHKGVVVGKAKAAAGAASAVALDRSTAKEKAAPARPVPPLNQPPVNIEGHAANQQPLHILRGLLDARIRTQSGKRICLRWLSDAIVSDPGTFLSNYDLLFQFLAQLLGPDDTGNAGNTSPRGAAGAPASAVTGPSGAPGATSTLHTAVTAMARMPDLTPRFGPAAVPPAVPNPALLLAQQFPPHPPILDKDKPVGPSSPGAMRPMNVPFTFAAPDPQPDPHQRVAVPLGHEFASSAAAANLHSISIQERKHAADIRQLKDSVLDVLASVLECLRAERFKLEFAKLASSKTVVGGAGGVLTPARGAVGRGRAPGTNFSAVGGGAGAAVVATSGGTGGAMGGATGGTRTAAFNNPEQLLHASQMGTTHLGLVLISPDESDNPRVGGKNASDASADLSEVSTSESELSDMSDSGSIRSRNRGAYKNWRLGKVSQRNREQKERREQRERERENR